VWSGPQFESIDVPGALSRRAFDINARGTVVGDYTDEKNKVRGLSP
jgi:hypothetical protein